jgi:hypothetical protein
LVREEAQRTGLTFVLRIPGWQTEVLAEVGYLTLVG